MEEKLFTFFDQITIDLSLVAYVSPVKNENGANIYTVHFKDGSGIKVTENSNLETRNNLLLELEQAKAKL